MGLRVILLPFFGKWALTTDAEKDYVGDALQGDRTRGREGPA
jgi:hypothetical protein